jgi:signal transduction histidine kinase
MLRTLRFHQIATQMRVGIFTILAALVFFAGLASYSLLRMTDTVETVVSGATQELEYVAELTQLPQQLRVLSALLENVRTPDDVTAVETESQIIFESMDAFKRLRSNRLGEKAAALVALRHSMNAASVAARRAVEIRIETDAIFVQIDALTRDISRLIEEGRIDSELAFHAVARLTRDGGQTDALIQNASGLSDAANLASRVESVSLILQTVKRGDNRLADNSVGAIGANLSAMIVELAKARDFSTRDQLAQHLADLHQLTSGTGNLTSLMIDLQMAVEEQKNLQQDVAAAVITFSADVVKTTQSIRTQVSDVTGYVSRSAHDFIFRSVTFTIIATIVILAILLFVIERRLLRRLHLLETHTLALAAGELDRDINIGGNDELSRMQDALKVFRRNAIDLRRSNSDLAEFAYTASHDLRSPLTAISNLLSWTIEDHADELSKPARDFIDTARQRCERLSRMLSELLDYARLDMMRNQEPGETVSVSKSVADVTEMLNYSDAFSVRVVGDPMIGVAETPLKTILRNLITNAIKHHDRDHGVVTVSVEHRSDGTILSVSDDGPGIAPQDHARIFKLFETLQPRDKVEGSGFGLAAVARLSEVLGGSVSVVSDPAEMRGTTFTIKLPFNAIT